MKLPLMGAGLVLGFALCGSAFAAEATDADATSGVNDSEVLTQTTDAKVVKKQQAQKAAENTKGGRPLTDAQKNSQKTDRKSTRLNSSHGE